MTTWLGTKKIEVDMKKWFVIIATAVAACAAVAFLVIGAWWNTWLLIVIYSLCFVWHLEER